MDLFISYLTSDTLFFLSWTLGVVFSICIHEYAHAAVALKLGDDTAARAGHLTLNPLIQMGPVSLFMLCMIGIAWGAVPVDVRRLRTLKDRALVSFAGPGSNLCLCLVAGLLAIVFAKALGGMSRENPAFYFLRLVSVANGVLFVFNMLPVPMFDGWSVFALLFPRMNDVNPQQAQTFSFLFLLVAFTTGLFGIVWGLGTLVADSWMGIWVAVLGVSVG